MKTVRWITVVGTIIALIVVYFLNGFDLLLLPVGMFAAFSFYTVGTLVFIIIETRKPIKSYPKPENFDKKYDYEKDDIR